MMGTTLEGNDAPLEGWRLTQAIAVMVNATIKEGHKPTKVVMHPKDFLDMADEEGKPWTLLMVAGLPIEINADCEPGKIAAVYPKP